MASIHQYPSLGKRIHCSSPHEGTKFHYNTRPTNKLHWSPTIRGLLKLIGPTRLKAPPSPPTLTIQTISSPQRRRCMTLFRAIPFNSINSQQKLQQLAHDPHCPDHPDTPRILCTQTPLISLVIFLILKVLYRSIKPSTLNISTRYMVVPKHRLCCKTPCSTAAQMIIRCLMGETSTIMRIRFRFNHGLAQLVMLRRHHMVCECGPCVSSL